MSGFDDNPFDDNPFKDPSIQQVMKNTADNVARDFGEFGNIGDVDPNAQSSANGSKQSPAVMSPIQETTPATFSNHGQQQSTQANPISTDDLQRRQEELDRKARELDRREEELRSNPYNVRRNNWPPLPEKFPVQPCFYQDINVDIPVEFQRVVRHLYYLWIIHAAALLVNSLVWILRIFVIEFSDITGFLLSLVYIAVFIPLSYLCWFRPAYKAFRSDSSFSFMVFFFVFFFQFIVSVLLSVYMTGSCGIYEGIITIKHGGAGNIIVGLFMLLVGCAFMVCAALDMTVLIRVHKVYRSTGASFAKAQQEFASGMMRNEHVQGAAANIASEAIRSQFNAGSATNNQPPRY